MIRLEKIECANIRGCQELLSAFWGSGRQGQRQPMFEYQWPREEI